MFQNSQWKVTSRGLETVRPLPTYSFEKATLLRVVDWEDGDGQCYDWPLHVADTKDWSDLDQFIEAWQEAIKIHERALQDRPDTDMMARSIEKARRIRGFGEEV